MTYINISIFTTQHAHTRNNRLARDVMLTNSIWRPITFQLDEMKQLPFIFYDREISYTLPFAQQPKVHTMLQSCLEVAPNSEIYVCYVGGNYFIEPHVIGCAYSQRYYDTWKGFIILTNAAASYANMYTFPHEIGHILLTRNENTRLTNADPDCPLGSPHHPDPFNLMHGIVPGPYHTRSKFPLLTSNQLQVALNSPLLRK
ncbi:DUF955 domain-containing protein [Ectobacillus antri]|uniref:DUF955 domain-containing protein n=1 Tax=Ectobacillus antri TaxID=2486280 RepID=UPI000F59441E|nr:DUF955 domain-containing protein [Ectobacillus antri]